MISHPSDTIKGIWQKIPRSIKAAFFSALLIGLLTHAFMLTNKLPNHDDLGDMVGDLAWAAMSGRWFVRFPSAISSVFSIPLVNGLLAIVYIALSASFAVACLRVRDTLSCALISGLMATMPSVASTLPYLQFADGYLFGLMLASLSAWLAWRYKYGFAPAAVILALSMGCYQAYYGAAAGLLIMALIFDILAGNDPWRKTLLKGVKFLCTLGAGMALYFVVVKLTAPADGLTTYMGIDQMGRISPSELPYLAAKAYWNVFKYFFLNSTGVHYPYMSVVLAVPTLLCFFLLARLCFLRGIYRQPVRLALLLALLLLLPLGCGIIYVMSPEMPHLLMIYPMALLPVFLIATASTCREFPGKPRTAAASASNLACWVVSAAVALCIFNYWSVSNKAYFKLFFAYEQAYAQSVSLVSRIQSLDGYTLDTQIILVGTPYEGRESYEKAVPELDDIQMTGIFSGEQLFGAYSYPSLLRRYLGFTQPVTLLQGEDLKKAEIPAQVKDMPRYPDSGCAAMLDGRIYVKFS